MRLDFVKMHGLGNDFVVIDALDRSLSLDARQIRRLADRRRGVGCDQVLMIQPARTPDAQIYFQIFNGDGSEAEQCGNGARCVARYLMDRRLTNVKEITADTLNGRLRMRAGHADQVAVDMGRPRFAPADIPLNRPAASQLYSTRIDGETVAFAALSMGNPHAVIVVDEVAAAPVQRIGGALQQDRELFPQGVNVGFMEIQGPERVALRVLERGAGETLACGSGACAAVVAGRRQGLLAPQVEVGLPGGPLSIKWADEEGTVWMTGPAAYVFQGEISL